jgi:histidinol-phosphate phosphatase family protein
MNLRYAVVVPTVGRRSLHDLLDALAVQPAPLPEEVVVVDDRPAEESEPLLEGRQRVGEVPLRVVRGWARGPAAARNLGWRLTTTPWVAFLDDDVVVPGDWTLRLADDLTGLPAEVAASQARIVVPLPPDRRPTDWERSTAGLQDARWITADMAYRREALQATGGFDERFPRAYREDADLALRVREAGWDLVRGTRTTTHPVRRAPAGISVRVQRGNADDALMRRLHGPDWRERAGAGRGRLALHLATTATATLALAAAPLTRVSPTARVTTRVCGGATALLLTELLVRRVTPGPRTPAEVVTMAWTSALIPPAAVAHRVRGWWRSRGARPWPPPPRAVLLDRDGTLVHDVPYNHDPAAVRPMASAAAAVGRLRDAGLRLGVVSNQSGIARGLLTREEVDAVNAQIDGSLGPFDVWRVCPHGPEDGCRCRKPGPGMVLDAARTLGVRPEDCVVIGDIGADVVAARRAGARAVLVPTEVTEPAEVRDAPVVAPDLTRAADLVLQWCGAEDRT